MNKEDSSVPLPATILNKGIQELITRKEVLTTKGNTNNFRYLKEVQVAYQLQTIFGEDVINQLANLDTNASYNYLNDVLGDEEANLYLKISDNMEKEYNLRRRNYSKINYSFVFDLIDKYKTIEQDVIETMVK